MTDAPKGKKQCREKRRRQIAYDRGLAAGKAEAAALSAAIAHVEQVLPNAFWTIAKGQLSKHELLFAAALFEGDRPIGSGESNTSPAEALQIALAAARSGNWVDPIGHETPDQAIIRQIAEMADKIGALANIPATELAGQFVSVLAANPEMIASFETSGSALFHAKRMNVEHGCLTYRAGNGAIVSPAELREQMGMTQ